MAVLLVHGQDQSIYEADQVVDSSPPDHLSLLFLLRLPPDFKKEEGNWAEEGGTENGALYTLKGSSSSSVVSWSSFLHSFALELVGDLPVPEVGY